MHSKKWVKEHEWKTISGNRVGFSGNDVVAPEFYKDFRKKQGWHEPKKSIIIDGKLKRKAIRHRKVKLSSVRPIMAEPFSFTEQKKLSNVKKLSERETFDFYYSRPSGHKDKVVLNAENDFFDVKVSFNKWNENNEAIVHKIEVHQTIEEEKEGYKNNPKFDWMKNIKYPIKFPTTIKEKKTIEVPLITDPKYKLYDAEFERREDERMQNEDKHGKPKDGFFEEVLGFDTGDIKEMKLNSVLDDAYLMDDGSTFTDKKEKEWVEHEAMGYEKLETKSESIDNTSSYLKQEYQKLRDTLSLEPIIVFPKNIGVIQEAVDFAKSNATRILFPFKRIDFLIKYRKDYQNNKIVNLEVYILDKSNKVIYDNKDYDINLTAREILQIVKKEEKRLSVDDWKWTKEEKKKEAYRVYNENTHEIMSGMVTYKTVRKILRRLSEQYPTTEFSINHV